MRKKIVDAVLFWAVLYIIVFTLLYGIADVPPLNGGLEVYGNLLG